MSAACKNATSWSCNDCSAEKQNQLKIDYKAEVAYRATAKKLGKFRATFGVEKSEDTKKRLSDRAFQIRMYTKVDRDAWENEDLREWYNDKNNQNAKFVSANQALDSAASSFLADKPSDTDPHSLNNAKSHYMLQCGGPHDPGGFLKAIHAGRASPGKKTVSMGTLQPTDSRVMEIAAEANVKRDLPHLHARPQEAAAVMAPPHWAHWQKNLNYGWNKLDTSYASGGIPQAAETPWALGD